MPDDQIDPLNADDLDDAPDVSDVVVAPRVIRAIQDDE